MQITSSIVRYPVCISLLACLLTQASVANDWQGAYLGIGLDRDAEGIKIGSVRPGTPADLAGLKSGELIKRLGDFVVTPKTSTADLIRRVKQIAPLAPLEIAVERGGETKVVEIVPAPSVSADADQIADRILRNRIIGKYAAKEGAEEVYRDIRASLRNCVAGSEDRREVYEKFNRTLDKLNVSHLALIPEAAMRQLHGKGEIGKYRLGMTIQRHETDQGFRYFIRDLLDGGPAIEAGLKIGDEIVAIDDELVIDSARRMMAGYEWRHQMYRIDAKQNETLAIGYRRHADGPIRKVDITIDRRVDASSATRHSLRFLFDENHVYGYIHIWNLLSRDIADHFDEAMSLFENCDGIVIDLRGRGGSLQVTRRVLESVRNCELPMVVLIDSQTRSAKEIAAFVIKKEELAPLVGVRTTGGVTGATFVSLPSGAGLMFPVTDAERLSRITDGVVLEGRGVEPDVGVPFELPYSAGRDSILEHGLKELKGNLTVAE